jgi:hypothetical protein
MKKSVLFCVLAGLVWSGIETVAQLKPEEISDYSKWEEFLVSAKITDQRQMTIGEGVTQPWQLTMEKDGLTKSAVWKNAIGLQKGFKESWKAEIAAYRLSKFLGLNMVPPTVEKEFRGDRGACQLFAEHWKDFEKITKEKAQPKGIKYTYFLRSLYLQRAFDNLISNEDRHQRNYLITEDWRMILIDHSRSFRTTAKFTKKLIYDEKFKEGKNFIMDALPRKFYESIKSLTKPSIKDVVGEYLTDEEIDATLARRDLMVAWIENHIKEKGEAYVLYDTP